MSQSAIITKLRQLLTDGIRSEAEAVYLLVEVRKLLEQQDAKKDATKRYDYLKFYCDWALHAKLTGTAAQRILSLFSAANVHLKAGIELNKLPGSLRMKIDQISKMRYFERQLENFLHANGLPTLESTRSDGWIHFVHLYGRVVEDCPLVMTAKNTAASVASVVLRLELAKRMDHGYTWFKVMWIIQDKNGQSGTIDVYNSFAAKPHGPFAEPISPSTD